MHYRNRSQIIAEVLLAVRDSNRGQGASIRSLIRRCNVSYTRLKVLLATLEGAGLLNEIRLGRSRVYTVSQEGTMYLEAWSRFEDFSQSYGLKL
jgi:predicted transcriptional regulator